MDDETKPQTDETPEPEDDVEGNALRLALGFEVLNRNARRHPEGGGKRQDEDLPRLTKQFPRMRDQRRG